MQLDIYQVDAFAHKIFEGNPAAVCPLDFWPDDELLQHIALENNLSETAFYARDDVGYKLRWFTPTTEVRLCGHATLATAHVLFSELGFDKPQITFHTLSGALTVKRIEKTLYLMDFPSDHPLFIEDEEIHATIQNALSAPISEVWKGRDDYLVILEDEKEVKNLDPDFRLISQLDSRGLIVSAKSSSLTTNFISRGFFPQTGVDEDPATGSAHTMLTPYWSPRCRTNRMKAIQWSQRKGYFESIYKGDRTVLIGNAVTYLKGKIEC